MIKFKHQFICILSGPSVCGKTIFCVRFLQHLDMVCTVPKFCEIVWCFSERSAVPQHHLPNIRIRIYATIRLSPSLKANRRNHDSLSWMTC
jgi:hypothetical protein